MLTRDEFCRFISELMMQWKKREEVFKKLDGYINFEPFYDTDFFHMTLKALAMTFTTDRIRFGQVFDDLEYWAEYYFFSDSKACSITVDGVNYILDSASVMYDYLVKVDCS